MTQILITPRIQQILFITLHFWFRRLSWFFARSPVCGTPAMRAFTHYRGIVLEKLRETRFVAANFAGSSTCSNLLRSGTALTSSRGRRNLRRQI
jgi:hypothetical protein